MACLVEAIKCTTFLLPEGHENDRTFGYNCVNNKCGQHDDEDGQKGEAKMELASLDIPKRMLQKESTGLCSTHLARLLFKLEYDLLLL